MEQTSSVKKSDDLFLSLVSLDSHISFRRSHVSFLPSHPSLLLLLTGVRDVTLGKFFEIMLACRRVLANFGRKNSVFDEPTKSSPSISAKSLPPIFFHGAFAPGFTWCRRPWLHVIMVQLANLIPKSYWPVMTIWWHVQYYFRQCNVAKLTSVRIHIFQKFIFQIHVVSWQTDKGKGFTHSGRSACVNSEQCTCCDYVCNAPLSLLIGIKRSLSAKHIGRRTQRVSKKAAASGCCCCCVARRPANAETRRKLSILRRRQHTWIGNSAPWRQVICQCALPILIGGRRTQNRRNSWAKIKSWIMDRAMLL
jgi:hypothetical protein